MIFNGEDPLYEEEEKLIEGLKEFLASKNLIISGQFVSDPRD